MSKAVVDVSATIEYSRDKWLMDKVPWALWVVVGGLAVVLYEGHGFDGAGLAFAYLALLGLAFVGWALTTLIDRSDYPFYLTLPAWLLVTALVAAVIVILNAYFGGSSRSSVGVIGQGWWGRLVNPPFHVFGWTLIDVGLGWTAYAIYRHIHPGRSIVMASTRGVALHRTWLRDILIPWPEVHGVGALEIENSWKGGAPTRNPDVIAVAVTKSFYEQHIAPKRRNFEPPGTEYMFRPKGELMQVVLTRPELTVAPEDLRQPIEARWQAFSELSVPKAENETKEAHAAGPPPAPPVVYGHWSFDGSWWQTFKFLTPFVGMAIVVIHATGFWPR